MIISSFLIIIFQFKNHSQSDHNYLIHEILKSEYFYGQKFNSIEELEQAVNEYIHYYNHERIKVKLRGLSSVQYRTQSLNSA
ncbi:hypothetical protein ACIN8IBEIGE_160374 [Acinetobacter sp. 8I-beige]|nr:hypothetical protein ACIN8IBEIGE_160374 [Acinetobacter sp. 8I-beige]